jgi:hypothetical protein
MAKNFELEFLKLENEKLKMQLQKGNNGIISKEELLQLLNLAANMRDVLSTCRQQQIDIRVARMIDDVLAQAAELD